MEKVPASSSLTFDGLSVIQQLPKGLDTFGTISEFILKRITSNNAKEVMFVTDQYSEASIKVGERERRAATGQIRVTPNKQVELFFLIFKVENTIRTKYLKSA